MKVIFLGTNGWYDTDTGNTTCILIETEKEFLILDAGNGFYKIDRYIKDSQKPIFLFLSHFHLDHIIGLHILNKFNFSQGINVFGPPGTKQMFHRVINTPYSQPLEKLKTKIKIVELSCRTKLPIYMEFKELFHTTICYGYRFTSGVKTLAFCADTGLCNNLNLLAQNADLLVAESSLRPGEIDKSWPHLNPEQAAAAAKKAGAKKLALVHFDAGVYLTEKDRMMAQESARKIFKNTVAAEDGLCIDI